MLFPCNSASSIAMFFRSYRACTKFYNSENQYCILIWLQGKKNPATDQAAVKSFLGQVKGAREMNIDRYRLAYKELKIMFCSWHCMSSFVYLIWRTVLCSFPIIVPLILATLEHVLMCSVRKKTLGLTCSCIFLFQLAYHHEDANSTGRPMRSYCSLRSSTFIACFPPCISLRFSQFGKKYLSQMQPFSVTFTYNVKADFDSHALVLSAICNIEQHLIDFPFSGGLPHIPWRILELF